MKYSSFYYECRYWDMDKLSLDVKFSQMQDLISGRPNGPAFIICPSYRTPLCDLIGLLNSDFFWGGVGDDGGKTRTQGTKACYAMSSFEIISMHLFTVPYEFAAFFSQFTGPLSPSLVFCHTGYI
jgi:hypothetical protein